MTAAKNPLDRLAELALRVAISVPERPQGWRCYVRIELDRVGVDWRALKRDLSSPGTLPQPQAAAATSGASGSSPTSTSP